MAFTKGEAVHSALVQVARNRMKVTGELAWMAVDDQMAMKGAGAQVKQAGR